MCSSDLDISGKADASALTNLENNFSSLASSHETRGESQTSGMKRGSTTHSHEEK
ncbi:hypothetical protein [Klebsiella pneumoniae]|uniref:hypothetical protein n=1 Tax=Klebsiella pneumoniae TaxID=573 RepID=UPI00202CFB7C|nr:hypothetical protein [Klebsiella pneumoniae]MCL9963049.1 hypothetical protein [Klebsiella pneumoniae]